MNMNKDIAGICLIFFVVANVPTITTMSVLRNSPLNTKFSFEPGEPIIVENNNVRSLFISGIPMEEIKKNSFFGAIDLYYDQKTYIAGTIADSAEFFVHPIRVLRPYGSESIQLRFPSSVQKNVIEADEAQKQAERQLLKRALASVSPAAEDNCWTIPIKSKIVSHFGSPRVLKSNKRYYHGGVDLRAGVGTPVKAAATGIVTLAEQMIVPGNIVVVDHGAGIHSMYMHLDKFKVRSGEKVHRGQVIALSGGTGRVEAPHLHWEVRWKGVSLNPMALLRVLEPFCGPK